MSASIETTTGPQEPATAPPLLVGVHHVKFPVTDLARSRAWYERVLGLVVELEFHDTDGSVRGIACRLPGCEAKVALREDPAVARGMAGFQPVAFAVTDRVALEAWADWLDRLGVEHSPVLEASVGWVLIVHDPNGIELHLYSWQDHGIDLTDPRAGRRVDTVVPGPGTAPGEPVVGDGSLGMVEQAAPRTQNP
jgi:catechol 2,3-dioxygenase-like lactoylglutathione lyase family enzyme